MALSEFYNILTQISYRLYISLSHLLNIMQKEKKKNGRSSLAKRLAT